jgi:hypothetical protein
MQIVPGWGLWFFGPHMGGFNFLLFFLFMFLLLSFLRRGGGYGGYNRRGGGYYRSGPPNYHSGHPYPGYGPMTGDEPRREQTTGESRAYRPEGGQQRPPYGNAGYGPSATRGGEGQATQRVESQSGGEGQPTMRVTPPAATVRMEAAETTGQATTPLGSTPRQSSEKARTEPGQAGGTEDYNS